MLTKLQLQNLEQTCVDMVLSINIDYATASRCWNLQKTESHQSSLLNSGLLACYKGRQSDSGLMKNHLISQAINIKRTSTLATFVCVIIRPKSDHCIAMSVTESVQRFCQTGRSSLLFVCFWYAFAMRFLVAKSQQVRVCTRLLKVITCNQSFTGHLAPCPCVYVCICADFGAALAGANLLL